MGEQTDLPIEIFKTLKEIGEVKERIDTAAWRVSLIEAKQMEAILVEQNELGKLRFPNDKARDGELVQRLEKDPAYITAANELRDAKRRRDFLEATVELKRSQFRLFVLELRGALVGKE